MKKGRPSRLAGGWVVLVYLLTTKMCRLDEMN
jgi:hypothetical protein